MKIITKRADGTRRVQTLNEAPSMTDTSWADDCDINNIIEQFTRTGQINHMAKHAGTYADVSEIPDLQEAFSIVQRSQEAFDDLPAELRTRFNNSPIEMVSFLQDTQNNEEAYKLGLKTRPQSSEDIIVPPLQADESKRKRAQSQPKENTDGENT